MVRFSHKCIPLTSNLREPKCKVASACEDPDDSVQWEQILRVLVRAIRKGEPEMDPPVWTYDHETLWSPRLVDTRGRKVDLFRCSKDTFIGVLQTRTYWYRRLPSSGRLKVKYLAADTKGRHFLRDVLNTVDGVLTSLIFSFPEMFLKESYALSDRITSSVIMNCFHNYYRFQKNLKKLRKTVKHAMLSKKEVPLSMDSLRDMSFFVRPIQCFNGICKGSSKEKMFRTAMFCQTRATGLADKVQMDDTVQEFLKTVTVKRKFEPDELLLQCIDEVTSELAGKPYLGTNPEFKISMSTSACRESSRENEGKFGYLKTLVRDSEIHIPPLRDGVSGTLGKWLWPEAAEKLLSGDKSVMKVNVAAVRENGKARVITSGSFWKDVALQPFSHITLHLIKQYDNLKSGLKASRLGWRFIEKIVRMPNDRGGVNWIFDEKSVHLYTSDWSKATDAPTPESGWAVTGKLLEKCGLDQYSLDVVKSYWLGPKELFYRGKHVGTLVNGIPMGDPLTKTNLSLAHPICDRYARYKLLCKSHEEGNGDDTSAISTSADYGKYHLAAAEMLGYEKSPEDDVTTNDWGTYAEEWFHLPTSNINTTKWGTRFQNSLLLPYLDTPKIRVMIATQKDRVDFSSDPTGKVTLLGHDQEYFKFKDPGPFHSIYSVASAFQDICLSTIDDKRPLFLPRQVNGVGKPPPHWSVDSWMNILSRCRTWHAKYYLAVMEDFVNGTQRITGIRGTLKESNHFSNETMVEIYEIPLDDPIRRLIVVPKEKHHEWPAGVLQKLVTLGYLIPESKLAKYYLFQERLEQLEQDTKRDLFEVVKAEMVEYPDTSYDNARKLVKRFVKEFRDYPFLLKGRRQENLYASAAIEGLEKGNPLTVPHTFPLIQRFNKRVRPSTPYEEDGLLLYQWFMGAFKSKRLGEEVDPPPTDILEDDPIMIQKIQSGGADVFLLVTDDIKLYRLALNKFPDTWVFQVSPLEYLQSNTWLIREYGEDADYDDAITELMQDEFGSDNFIVEAIVDKGSVESYLNKYFEAEAGIYWQTIGIPWRKCVKRSNMERKPRHGFINTPELKSFKELRWPLHFMGRETYQVFKKSVRSA